MKRYKELKEKSGKPSKKELDQLVRAYALQKYSAMGGGATIRIQQKFYDSFYTKLEAFSKKYSNYDTTSDNFYSQLDILADKWWNSQAIRGAGKHW